MEIASYFLLQPGEVVSRRFRRFRRFFLLILLIELNLRNIKTE